MAVLLVGVSLEVTILLAGPPFDYRQLAGLTDALRWLTVSPEPALGALGLVAGGILGISLSSPPVAARITAAEVSNHRGRLLILDLFSFTALLIAWMVVFRLATATDRAALRDSFGLGVFVVLASLITSALAEVRVRHEELEQELAEQDAQSLETRSARMQRAWDRGWPGVVPNPRLGVWRRHRRPVAVFLLLLATTLAVADVAALLADSRASAIQPGRLAAILFVQLVYFFMAPVAVAGYVTHKLRSCAQWSERLFAIGTAVLSSALLLSLVASVLMVMSWHVSVACVGLPLVAAALTIVGFVRRDTGRAARWAPWSVSHRVLIDFAARQEGLRRKRVRRRARELRDL